MTVRKVVNLELRKDSKLQKLRLQMMLSQLLWLRVRLQVIVPGSGGGGTAPEHEPPAAAAQSRSNAGEVLKMQRQIAEL